MVQISLDKQKQSVTTQLTAVLGWTLLLETRIEALLMMDLLANDGILINL
jgi:hypothetical protein